MQVNIYDMLVLHLEVSLADQLEWCERSQENIVK